MVIEREETINILKDGRVFIRLNEIVYEKQVVLATASKFTDRCYIYITHFGASGEGDFEVYFIRKTDESDESLEQIAKEYLNQLLKEQLEIERGKD